MAGRAGRSVDDLLWHIVEWGERLEKVVGKISWLEFSESELHRLAASKCIEAIGEAAGNLRKLHPDFASKHPELAFEQAYRTRNRLSHGYDTIDWTVVWTTARRYVPELVGHARGLIAQNDGE
ncbi:HepT-like ribonuclease domain-containing protein [Mesorhizobium sp. WSM2239]|uniref:HepT-like ribonuclease domain-containing protein n=2 Tax=unclassified Mesorhizobium TaxID=325217 RepID=A0AAU8D504_9HYPH